MWYKNQGYFCRQVKSLFIFYIPSNCIFRHCFWHFLAHNHIVLFLYPELLSEWILYISIGISDIWQLSWTVLLSLPCALPWVCAGLVWIVVAVQHSCLPFGLTSPAPWIFSAELCIIPSVCSSFVSAIICTCLHLSVLWFPQPIFLVGQDWILVLSFNILPDFPGSLSSAILISMVSKQLSSKKAVNQLV